MAVIKTLDLIVQVERINPQTQEVETVQREVSVPEQAIINQLINRFPVLGTVQSITISDASWSVATTPDNQ